MFLPHAGYLFGIQTAIWAASFEYYQVPHVINYNSTSGDHDTNGNNFIRVASTVSQTPQTLTLTTQTHTAQSQIPPSPMSIISIASSSTTPKMNPSLAPNTSTFQSFDNYNLVPPPMNLNDHDHHDHDSRSSRDQTTHAHLALQPVAPSVSSHSESTTSTVNTNTDVNLNGGRVGSNDFSNYKMKNNYNSTNSRETRTRTISSVGGSRHIHWSRVIVTPYIYEKFMNFLTREFAVENLLFITEYIQIKNVLKQKYDNFSQMMKENKSIRFDIKLPQNEIDNHDINVETKTKTETKTDTDTEKTTTTSRNKKHVGNNDHRLSVAIAIGHMKKPSYNSSSFSNITDIPTMPVSLIAKQLYDNFDIIIAFKSLYNKYIDEYNAPFMINISSHCRKTLMKSLDSNYFQRCMSTKNEKGIKIIKPSLTQNISDKLKNARYRSSGSSGSNGNNGSKGSDDVMMMMKMSAFIDKDWIDNERSIDWLLVRLTSEMDTAAREISQLIQQSFVRFRKAVKISL